MRSMEEQFQIGDEVLYVREGIVTVVQGYDWTESINGPPVLRGYRLACGILVPFAEMQRVVKKNPA